MTNKQTSTAEMITLVTLKMMKAFKLEEPSLSSAPMNGGTNAQEAWHASWIAPPLQFMLENDTRHLLIQEQQFHFSVIQLTNILMTVSRPLYNSQQQN